MNDAKISAKRAESETFHVEQRLAKEVSHPIAHKRIHCRAYLPPSSQAGNSLEFIRNGGCNALEAHKWSPAMPTTHRVLKLSDSPSKPWTAFDSSGDQSMNSTQYKLSDIKMSDIPHVLELVKPSDIRGDLMPHILLQRVLHMEPTSPYTNGNALIKGWKNKPLGNSRMLKVSITRQQIRHSPFHIPS